MLGLSYWWKTVGDGSLRGELATEAVSQILYGTDALAALDNYEVVSAAHKEHFTFRCSTHIHLNMLDLPIQKFPVLALVTLGADNFLYAAGNRARHSNYNCRPLSLLAASVEALAISMYHLAQGAPLIALHHLPEHLRYQGTNWTALGKHGTLEFRHFPGERSAARIVQWLNLVFGMYTYAERHTYDDVIELLTLGPEAFCADVFQGEMYDLLYEGCEADWTETEDMVEDFQSYFTEASKTQTFDSMLRSSYFLIGEH